MNFTNDQISTAELPSVLDIRFKSLEPQLRTVYIVTSFIIGIVIISIPLGINLLSRDTWFMDYARYIIPAWLVLVGFIMLLSLQSYRHQAYALRERDIVWKKGWIWRSITVVPFNRIQHTEIEQGPIERLFGLSTLKIYTAGGSSSDISIPGLTPDIAHRLKDYIQLKVGTDEEE